MSDDQLPPAAGEPHAYQPTHMVDEQTRRFSGRARLISWIVAILCIVLVIGAVIWLSHASSSSASGPNGGGRRGGHGGGGGPGGPGGPGGGPGQVTTVGTVKATIADLPVQTEALGNVTPAATVTVIPQVSGTITQVLFQEGQKVAKGQALAIIDPRPYRAALLQAQGNLLRDKAQLENAQVQLKRYDILIAQDSIARQDRDTQAALVHQYQGTVMADQGAVDQAQINLGYTRIVSPVSGRIGLRVVDIGNYIASGTTTGIAVVTTLQPIDVEFAIPQQQAPAIEKRIAGGATIPAIVLDSTRTDTLDTGRFMTLNNQVDTTTGTIKGKARMPNAAGQLYPSQFVNVRLTIDTVKNAITVPPSAVRTGPDGDFVWLLKPDRTVTQRVIKSGVNTADQVQITSGLAVGDTVVTDGGDRLTEGATVALPGDKPVARAGGKGGKGGRHRRGGNGG
ncbi:efflux RND transporter periplasmic adaptor subunit [Sphingomonas abietis]|uniref:Efflux RND transporter periplasmic adaptor subunit n=1 Tax=Sphingomonas abietis TaxID=3012344 RepID=A0ABY7NSU2_9SPHN|nr:efflux RND transporter periplasmic adaptor subunit [Sphingomonas abietis]WBO24020.1 efflux RND transporter periplasmic adaptor subunit [Sphingomonas abietis]